MGFDAGSIEATLTIKRDQAQRDIDAIRAEARKFAAEKFQASLGISTTEADAAMRALEARFEILRHALARDIDIRVAENMRESASGGGLLGNDQTLLKKLEQEANTPGGIGIIGTGSDTSIQRLLRQSLERQATEGTDTGVSEIGKGVSGSDTQRVTQEVSQKLINEVGGPSDVTQDVREQLVGGTPTPGETTETVRLSPDSTDLDLKNEEVEHNAVSEEVKIKPDIKSDAASAAATTFGAAFISKLDDVFGKGHGGSGVGVNFGNDFANGVAGGMGPGILGIKGKLLAIFALGGPLLGALPALGGVAGVGIGVAMIAGVAGALLSQNAKIKSAFSSVGKQALDVLKQTIQPLVPIVLDVIHQILPLVKEIAPALTGIFKEIGPSIEPIFKNVASIVKDLVAVMQAAAPAFGPFINGLLDLVKDILPPLASGIRATVPFISEFGKTLGTLGADIGSIFNSAGPAIKASMTILDDLLKMIGGILPTLMKLASELAVSLAPAFSALGGAIVALEPVFTIIGKVITELASAMLDDLVSAITAIATMFKDMAPGLAIFAKALGQVFQVLENTGVFAVIGDAVESLAKPLADLVNVIAEKLAPVLPTLIGAFGKLAGVLTAGLATIVGNLAVALTGLIAGISPSVLTSLVDAIVKIANSLTTAVVSAAVGIADAIIKLLAAMEPSVISAVSEFAVAIAQVATVMTPVLAGAITGVAKALTAIITAIPPGVLSAIALSALAVGAALKTWEIAQAIAGGIKAAAVAMGILDGTMDANPIGIVILALAALGIAIAELVTHWHTVWTTIEGVFADFEIWFAEGVKAVADVFLDWVGDILNGAVAAFGWIPGVGTKLKQAQSFFDSFKTGVNDDFQNMITGAQNWRSNLDTNTSRAAADLQKNQTAYSNLSTGVHSSFSKMVTDADNWRTNLDVQGSAAQSRLKAIGSGFVGMGDNAKTAMSQIQSLIKNLARVPAKTLDAISVSASGQISVATSGGRIMVGATGMLVSGGTPGKDSVLAALMPGELVVPTHMVGAGMVDHLRGAIPGFAGGGYVGNATGLGDYVYDRKVAIHQDTINAAAVALSRAIQGSLAAASGAGGGYAGPGGGAPAANAALARRLYPAWGSGSEWDAWNNVAMRESGWNQYADNASSGAYGIPQALPYTKMPKAGWPASAGGSSNPTAQITWMIDYIKGRYGDPEVAWAHELTAGWYDRGGWLSPGATLMLNKTGQSEAVLTPAESQALKAFVSGGSISDQMERLIQATGKQGQMFGLTLMQALNNMSNTAVHRGLHTARRW